MRLNNRHKMFTMLGISIFTVMLLAVCSRYDRYLLIRPLVPVLPTEKARDSVEVKSVFSDSSRVEAGATLRGYSGKELTLNGELLLDKTRWHFSVFPLDSKSVLFGFSREGQAKIKTNEKSSGHLPEAWLQFHVLRKSSAPHGFSIVRSGGSFVHSSGNGLKWSVGLLAPDATGEYLIYCQLTDRDKQPVIPNLQSTTDGFIFARRLSVSFK